MYRYRTLILTVVGRWHGGRFNVVTHIINTAIIRGLGIVRSVAQCVPFWRLIPNFQCPKLCRDLGTVVGVDPVVLVAGRKNQAMQIILQIQTAHKLQFGIFQNFILVLQDPALSSQVVYLEELVIQVVLGINRIVDSRRPCHERCRTRGHPPK